MKETINTHAAPVVGGTLLTIFAIPAQDLINAAGIAFIGATVSFLASKLCAYLWKKLTKKHENKSSDNK
jgi:hypothetical protein